MVAQVLKTSNSSKVTICGKTPELLFEYAEIANFTAEEKARYEQDMTTERDRINQLAYAEEKSYKKGKNEGEKEGETKATHAIARNMLENGVAVESISKWTGLSVEEISKL